MRFGSISNTSPLAPGGGTGPVSLPFNPSVGAAKPGDRLALALDQLALGGHAAPAPRTPADVRLAADRVFFPPVTDAGRAIHLERDALDVNGPVSASTLEEVQGQILANAGMEAMLLRTLGPERQAQYEGIAQLVAADPLARLGLQVLLTEGKLQAPRAHDGRDLLATLDALGTAPLAAGLERGTLLGDLVQEAATPSAITQQYHGTCSVTSVQIKLATENPAEYARLVGGLASPAGRVTLAGGQTLARLPGTERPGTITQRRRDGTAITAPDPRSTPSRLWQPALMQFGYGAAVKYDDATDRIVSGRAAPGITSLNRVMGAIAGQAPEVVTDWKLAGNTKVDGRDDLIARVAREATPQHPVAMAMLYGEPQPFGHEVLVNRIKDGQVHFSNPWGMEERVSIAEFKQRIAGGYAHLGHFD